MHFGNAPVSFTETNNQYAFNKGTELVAIGEYNSGEFFLMEDEDVYSFPNAANAFCYINTKYRCIQSNRL